MTQSQGDMEVVRGAWEAFSRGDVTAATAVLAPDVRWCGVDSETPQDGCHNRVEALAFVRQAIADGVSAEVLDIREVGERVVVLVQTRHPPEWGHQPEPHGEVVTVTDGEVTEMVVYPTVDEALAAAT